MTRELLHLFNNCGTLFQVGRCHFLLVRLAIYVRLEILNTAHLASASAALIFEARQRPLARFALEVRCIRKAVAHQLPLDWLRQKHFFAARFWVVAPCLPEWTFDAQNRHVRTAKGITGTQTWNLFEPVWMREFSVSTRVRLGTWIRNCQTLIFSWRVFEGK